MPNSTVLDSFAVLAFLEKEPGHETVAELFQLAAQGEVALLMSVVNMGEVWYQIARGHSDAIADEKIAALKDLGVNVADADWQLTRQAALYKKSGGISFADCYAAALAKISNAPVVTGDAEFKRVEKDVKVRWIGK